MTAQRLWLSDVKFIYIRRDRICAPRSGRTDTIMNAILVAETLSDSTEAYDRSENFAHCRTLETFQEYVPTHQYRPCVEQYAKSPLCRTIYEAVRESVVVFRVYRTKH